MTMRAVTTSAIIAVLSLGAPAFAQTQGTPSNQGAQAPAEQSSRTIQSIQVIDVKDLKPELRTKVDELVSSASEQDLRGLRESIDAMPQAASALKARGFSSSQVVAVNVANGVLTIFAKTA
jgi:hypothetical protein